MQSKGLTPFSTCWHYSRIGIQSALSASSIDPKTELKNAWESVLALETEIAHEDGLFLFVFILFFFAKAFNEVAKLVLAVTMMSINMIVCVIDFPNFACCKYRPKSRGCVHPCRKFGSCRQKDILSELQILIDSCPSNSSSNNCFFPGWYPSYVECKSFESSSLCERSSSTSSLRKNNKWKAVRYHWVHVFSALYMAFQ